MGKYGYVFSTLRNPCPYPGHRTLGSVMHEKQTVQTGCQSDSSRQAGAGSGSCKSLIRLLGPSSEKCNLPSMHSVFFSNNFRLRLIHPFIIFISYSFIGSTRKHTLTHVDIFASALESSSVGATSCHQVVWTKVVR